MPDEQSDREPWEENFRQRMREQRERLGLSQSELARRVRRRGPAFHQQSVARIESGERSVRLGEAYLIAVELGVRLDDLVTSDETARLRSVIDAMPAHEVAMIEGFEDFAGAQYDLAGAAARSDLSDEERAQIEAWLQRDPIELLHAAAARFYRSDDEHLSPEQRLQHRNDESDFLRIIRNRADRFTEFRDGYYGGEGDGEHPEAAER